LPVTMSLESLSGACENLPDLLRGTQNVTDKQTAARTLTPGQRAYEAKRAAKAGMSLEKWLDSKRREQEAEKRARLKVAEAAKPPKQPGLFARLIERAHRPLGTSASATRTPPR
jgi:hypothetical protein